ncbi:hypothetical protein R2R35_04835 [Anaerocolumna sp. AGMB13020]|uniref:hypothetical protein n=1 Tax=Anaerocolumna sp. AGMB13020 TaxID=3081750 RepID=UPI002953F2F7|nr:hypothetical protein [Anaerocolumna sp. AGMB13020]WOO37829.1 hypothetical protein R2R35_04835 [Anaerocolumna sp. AGMB13020]
MSDFILDYEDLEAIARYSKDLGKEALEYSEDLEKTIVNNIDNVTGDSSGYLIQAADSVRDKIIALRQKSEAFYHFSDEITNLLIVADRMDQEVADAIAGQGEYSLEHQKAGRLEEWWVKLLDLLTDANKTILLLCIASLAKLKMKFDSLKSTIKDWYERECIKILEFANKIKMLNDYVKMAQGVGIYFINVTAARLLEYIGTNISGLNNGTKDDNVNLLDIIRIFYNPLMDINDFMVGSAVAIDNNVFGGLLQELGGTAEPFQLDRKAFNLGKTVTDLALMVAGTGAFIFGAMGGAGGAALSSTGVGAVAGVPLTAAGIATMSIGGGIALKSAQNLVGDGLNLMSGEGHGSSEGTGKTLYDIEGNYTGGRASTELDSLAKDPAHTGSNRPIDIEKGIHERTVGLNVEESGKIKGPIVRDPSGKAEFFDANGQAWDVKSFNSNFKPKKGGYTLESSLRSINKSLSEGEFVILDTSNLSSLHKAELLEKLSDLNLMDKIVTWP